MDKEICNVGTQYIICECGDNFPNEKFLNIHLANGHAEVETFQCDVCPDVFTSANSLALHISTHQSDKPETSKKLKLKTYSRKSPLKEIKFLDSADVGEADVMLEQPQVKQVKKPPVIKLKNLKRIDSISLIENLKAFGGFIKIEPLANTQEPELQTEPELPEPQPEPEPELPEPEPEAEPESIFMEVEEEEGHVIVKNEKQEAAEIEEEREEIYYQCDVCNSIFYTEWDFNVHYQSAHALKLEPGTGTPEQTLEQSLERHLVTDHADDEGVQAETTTAYYYECELCHKIFASEKYFNIHYNKTHAQPAVAVEDEETERESSEPAAQEPTEEAKSKAPHQVIYYKCDLCKVLYPTEKAYNNHFEKKHGGQSYQELQTGFQLIEQELKEEYECPTPPPDAIACEFCFRTFTMKRSLQVHRKRIHAELIQHTEQAREPARPASRSKVCDVCGRAYNSNAALRYHQRRHTGERPYACNMCPKRFTMPMFLQIHTRTHTGEKPYECPHCPKAFTNKAALIRHDRVHTGVKPYACPECGKMFTQSNSMKLHVSTVHLKLPAPYKSRSRRNKSEARALQLALKNLPQDDHVLGIKLEDRD